MVNGLEELQGRLDLSLGLAGFHCGAYDGDVLALGRHVMGIRDHAHIDVWNRNKALRYGHVTVPKTQIYR